MSGAQDLVERLQAEIPTWGHLSAIMRFKRDAVARFGVQEAFRLCQAHLSGMVPDLDELRETHLRGLRQAAIDSDWTYTELWRGGENFDRPPVRVIGPGNHGPLPGLGRSGWLACVPDAVVRSRSAFVRAGELALLDYEGIEYSRIEDIPQFDPAVLHATRERAWLMEAAQPSLRLDEAFLLTGRNAVDFGHWLSEYFPRYLLARLAGLPEHVPVLIDPFVPRTVREHLTSMLPAASRIVEAPHMADVAVAKLWCAANPEFSAYYPVRMDESVWSHQGTEAGRLAPLLREWARVARLDEAPSGGPTRLYLARKPTNLKKRLRNQEAIEAIARARGFEVRYPEDYELGEQLRMARNATHVLAPEGSNAMLTVFARPGTRAFFLSPPYTLPLVDVNSVLAALGVDLTVLTGPDFPDPLEEEFCGYWNDYEIDPALFERELDAWLAG
jgi:hypothetical protein